MIDKVGGRMLWLGEVGLVIDIRDELRIDGWSFVVFVRSVNFFLNIVLLDIIRYFR